MSQSRYMAVFLALALQTSQAQLFSRGAPASVTSPTPDGRQHGVPASVVSPTPLPFGVNPPPRTGVRVHGRMRRFGNPRGRRQVFVPIPLFYSYYTEPSFADPYVNDPPAEPGPAQQVQAGRSDEDPAPLICKARAMRCGRKKAASGIPVNRLPATPPPAAGKRSPQRPLRWKTSRPRPCLSSRMDISLRPGITPSWARPCLIFPARRSRRSKWKRSMPPQPPKQMMIAACR